MEDVTQISFYLHANTSCMFTYLSSLDSIWRLRKPNRGADGPRTALLYSV